MEHYSSNIPGIKITSHFDRDELVVPRNTGYVLLYMPVSDYQEMISEYNKAVLRNHRDVYLKYRSAGTLALFNKSIIKRRTINASTCVVDDHDHQRVYESTGSKILNVTDEVYANNVMRENRMKGSKKENVLLKLTGTNQPYPVGYQPPKPSGLSFALSQNTPTPTEDSDDDDF